MSAFLSVLSLFIVLSAHAQLASPIPAVAQATAQTVSPLKDSEKKPLLDKFKKELMDEEKNLDRDDRNSHKQFLVAQGKQLNEWRTEEKHARRSYFDEHLTGPDRRAYVQSYIVRKKDFDQKQQSDLAAFNLVLKEKHDTFKVRQLHRESAFQDAVNHNVRPDQSLWKH
jgi:hypothetical protein